MLLIAQRAVCLRFQKTHRFSIFKQVQVRRGGVELEVHFAQVLDRAGIFDFLNKQVDLFLAFVAGDRVELGLELVLCALELQVGWLGEVTINRELVDGGHIRRRAKLGPDLARRVEQTDLHLVVHDLVVGVIVHRRGHEQTRRLDRAQPFDERVLQTGVPRDSWLALDRGASAEVGRQVAVGKAQQVDA